MIWNVGMLLKTIKILFPHFMMINCGGCRQKFIKLRACAWQVADFGLAKLTVSGTGTHGIVGTFGYMPPTITEVHQH
jgi:hypothetical protein